MTPTIVLYRGKPLIVTGAPGGSRIITAVMQVLINVVDYRMSIAEAVQAPRIHHQWMPDETMIEAASSGCDREGARGARAQRAHLAAVHLGAVDHGDAAGPRRRGRHADARRAGRRALKFGEKLERAKGFEPSTPTLARSGS